MKIMSILPRTNHIFLINFYLSHFYTIDICNVYKYRVIRLYMENNTGKLVSIEGIDGAGKTSLIEGTNENSGLKSIYPDAFFTAEPNEDSWVGKQVRKAINQESLSDAAMFFMFLADHAQHVDEVIQPKLAEHNLVITDRYIDSRYAYQCYKMSPHLETDTLEWIQTIQEQSWTEIPDLTIILDIPVETSIERIGGLGNDAFEKKDQLEASRSIYKSLPDYSDRYEIVDGTQPVEDIIEACEDLINNNLNQTGK